MINPKIIKSGPGFTQYEYSNCGSLLLKEPIRVWRHPRIVVNYFNRDGVSCQTEGYLPTVQHEIDHNNGILITDRRVL